MWMSSLKAFEDLQQLTTQLASKEAKVLGTQMSWLIPKFSTFHVGSQDIWSMSKIKCVPCVFLVHACCVFFQMCSFDPCVFLLPNVLVLSHHILFLFTQWRPVENKGRHTIPLTIVSSSLKVQDVPGCLPHLQPSKTWTVYIRAVWTIEKLEDTLIHETVRGFDPYIYIYIWLVYHVKSQSNMDD